MSATTVAPIHRAHTLVRKVDSRGRGMWHAAIITGSPEAPVWRAACGRTIVPGASTETPSRDDAEAILNSSTSQLCAGCDRVGEAL